MPVSYALDKNNRFNQFALLGLDGGFAPQHNKEKLLTPHWKNFEVVKLSFAHPFLKRP